MKTIIAGSRGITDMALLNKAVAESQFEITEVVSGMARGVDTLAAQWAEFLGIPVTKMPADWNRHGKLAGYLRNEAMATYVQLSNDYPGQLIALWDGVSRGTKHMIDIAHRLGMRVFVYNTKEKN